MLYCVSVFSVAYDTDESRDLRSRRRMTDDDDTVLDNASVTSQDQDGGFRNKFYLLGFEWF